MMRTILRYTSIIAIAFLCSSTSFSQESNVLDGAYVKETNLTKRVIPYPHLREADVMYFRRIWQVMDLKQKINHPYYFPIEPISDRKNLFDVIKDGLLVEGSLIAYDLGVNDDDEFNNPLTTDEIYDIFNPIEKFDEYDDDGIEVIGTIEKRVPIKSDLVTRYVIKEDWIWDRQRSERYVRIIGIAPQIEDFDQDGESVGYKRYSGYTTQSVVTCLLMLTYSTYSMMHRDVLTRIYSKSVTSRATSLKNQTYTIEESENTLDTWML